MKMMDFFRNRRRTVFLIVLLCIAVLSGILLTNVLAKSNPAKGRKNTTVQSCKYNAAALMKFKTAYVGDNSNLVNLLDTLPFANLRGEVSIKTDNKPYGISVKYDFNTIGLNMESIEATFRENATLIFALIDNVDEISFNFISSSEERKYQYTRDQLQKSYIKDLRDYARKADTFETLLNSLSLSFIAYPEKYTLAMSSTPGIRILVQYGGTADKVAYSASYGNLLTWDSTSGKISEHGQNVELPLTTPVYWSPLVDGIDKQVNEIAVKAAVFSKNRALAQKQVNIKYDSAACFYTVVPSSDVTITDSTKIQPQNPKSVEEAVSLAVKDQGKCYLKGEVATEGHKILDTEEKGGIVTVYTVSSFGWFGFENGIFTCVSGSGYIPTVIKLSKNEIGEFSLLEYKEPMDGAYYTESIKKMFPRRLWDDVLNTDKYTDLVKQKEEQAREYLRSIGRNAKVSAAYVEKKLVNINVEASNKLFGEFTKNDAELNNFPYWIGTKELLENDVRYIYSTSQSKTSDGYALISFKKTKEDGTIVKLYQYKIVGSEPQLVG